ncbi:MAG TPA: hypothetical protein VFF36_14775, partial [Planctomycetota bacterium]|nr:hypothetical protein [Planctomycetota bacterium]
REMKDRDATPAVVAPITSAGLLALPQHRNVAEVSALERRAVSLDCRVVHLVRSTDGDFHLDCVADDSLSLHELTAEVTPLWRGRPRRTGVDSPGWGYERLTAVFHPGRGTTTAWEGGPSLVRLTGWLLYDGYGEGMSEALHTLLGFPRLRRPTDWEIHPFTKIERWDESLARWVEVLR